MGAQALPLNHPVTQHVRRVVSRILLASNLGTLSGETSLGRGTGLVGFGGFDAFGRDTSHSDVDLGASAHPSETYGPSKEWDVMVVNDRKTINALAVPGVSWILLKSFLARLIVICDQVWSSCSLAFYLCAKTKRAWQLSLLMV